MEKWGFIPGLEYLYEASTDGRIRSISRFSNIGSSGGKRLCEGKIIKTSKKINNAGYESFIASINAKPKTVFVHRAVWSAFNGLIPKDKNINHKNCNKRDNRLENLELTTFKENMQHALANGRLEDHRRAMSLRNSGPKNPKAKYDRDFIYRIKELHGSGMNKAEITRTLGCSRAVVCHHIRTKGWERY